MMTQDNILPQSFKDRDRTGLDDIVRMSPIPGEGYRDPYRCPVSTPANARRTVKENGYVTFTSINRRSLQIPNHIANPQSKHPGLNIQNTNNRASIRPETKPRKKNLDYYFTEKPVQLNSHGRHGPHSTGWLKSLCSQPVDEIFGKYKKRSEYQSGKDLWGRSISTPGERALVKAWSCNLSSRGSSSVSRSSRSDISEATESRVSSYLNPSLRVGSTNGTPSFALMPVTVPRRPKTERSKRSPRVTDLRRNRSQNNALPAEVNKIVVDDDFYDHFKRDDKKLDEPRFPELKSRRGTEVVSKQRKYLSDNPEVVPMASPSLVHNHVMEEGMIQIFPVGKMFDERRETGANKECSYCVADGNMNDKLPLLKSGNG